MARDSNTSQRPPNPRRGRFATTRWSLVQGALRRSKPGSRQALAELFDIYWYPLYSEARRMGLDPEVARDRVQGFFTRLLETDGLAGEQTRGRFRSFLLAAFHHFLANEWDRELHRQRGGAGRSPRWTRVGENSAWLLNPFTMKLPSVSSTAAGRWPPSTRFWVGFRKERRKAGKAKLFEVLSPALVGDRGVAYTELDAPRNDRGGGQDRRAPTASPLRGPGSQSDRPDGHGRCRA